MKTVEQIDKIFKKHKGSLSIEAIKESIYLIAKKMDQLDRENMLKRPFDI